VLLQEVQRYNDLLRLIRSSLGDLQKGIMGLVVISSELEDVYDSLFAGLVPVMWKQAYPSLKPLGLWTSDLCLRVEQLARWSSDGPPKVFWLAGFTFPTGFLTALLQTTARRNGVPIDELSWEFTPSPLEANVIMAHPKEGAYISGPTHEWTWQPHLLKIVFPFRRNHIPIRVRIRV
jgi:dynein heavy chain